VSEETEVKRKVRRTGLKRRVCANCKKEKWARFVRATGQVKQPVCKPCRGGDR